MELFPPLLTNQSVNSFDGFSAPHSSLCIRLLQCCMLYNLWFCCWQSWLDCGLVFNVTWSIGCASLLLACADTWTYVMCLWSLVLTCRQSHWLWMLVCDLTGGRTGSGTSSCTFYTRNQSVCPWMAHIHTDMHAYDTSRDLPGDIYSCHHGCARGEPNFRSWNALILSVNTLAGSRLDPAPAWFSVGLKALFMTDWNNYFRLYWPWFIGNVMT